MPVLLSSSVWMNFQPKLHGKSNMSPQDIQNEMILRESAYLADQLLKKLTTVQPVPPHTDVPPVRQSRPEALTAQIPSPKTSPMIQKPPPPQLSSTRARKHFNNLLIPQLRDTSHLGKRRSMIIRSATTDNYTTPTPPNPPPGPSDPEVEPAPVIHPAQRDQTWPTNSSASSPKTNLYIINEENTREASRSQQQYRQPFPQFPSQRLPPIPPRTSETKSAIEAQYRSYRQQNRQHEKSTSTRQQPPPPPPSQHPNNPQIAQAPTSTTQPPTTGDNNRGNPQAIVLNQRPPTVTLKTGKRRPGQGMGMPVPLIGPPPPGKRNRNRKGKGSAGVGSGGINSVNRGQEGWENVNVHGLRSGRPF